jgi:hypothetical protein
VETLYSIDAMENSLDQLRRQYDQLDYKVQHRILDNEYTDYPTDESMIDIAQFLL